MRKLLIYVVIALIAISCTKEKLNKENISEIVEAYASKDQLNGSLIIAQKNNIIYQESFGLADVETKTKITSSTVFPIASVTKQFTATAIMILQENGKLSINDKIGNYLEVPPTVQDIPIKNLMNMTSGLYNYWENDVISNKDSILKFHHESESLYFATNTKFHYNNSNYFFLGLLIESVSEMSYSDFLTQNIFKPANMINTVVYEGKEIKRAIGYDQSGNKNDYLITTSDGCILSSAEDLLKWDIALSDNKIITKDSKNKMFEPIALNNGEMNDYCFGWKLEENQDSIALEKRIVSHTGGLAGFGAYNQYDTKKDLYFILLSNQLRPELMNLINDINKELY